MPNPTTFTTTLRWLLNRIEDDRLPAPTHATGWADGHWNFSVATETDLTQWAAYLNATPSVAVSKHGDSRLNVTGTVGAVSVVVFSDETQPAPIAQQIPA